MSKILVYPFDVEFEPIIKCLENNSEINSLVLSSPNGWGYVGTEYNWKNQVIVITNEFESLLDDCDEVWFVPSRNFIHPIDIIINKVEASINMKKNTYFWRNPKELESVRNEVKDKIIMNNSYIVQEIVDHDTEIYQFEVPIIGVMGNSEQTSKFELELMISERLRNLGYDVSLVASKAGFDMLDLYSFPQWMICPGMTELQKIVCFNHYIKSIETINQPDIIIIGIPGFMYPFSNRIHGDFGVLHFEISWAIEFDYIYFSLLFGDYDSQVLNRIKDIAKNTFGYEIDCFNLSNNLMNPVELEENEATNYVTIPDHKVLERLITYNSNSHNMISNRCVESVDIAVDRMIKTLEGYLKTTAV